jgi:glycosyltransferase involved in cell wall biosynthesis
MSRAIDHLIFITENEQATFHRSGGRGRSETVIANIISTPPSVTPHPAVPNDGRLRIACLSNYSWYRGLDRLVDVALQLRSRRRADVLFVMAGDMRLTRSMPGDLGRLGRAGKTLVDYAAQRGVAPYFLFLGHVAEPERVLAACHALAKPSRENNPWGRDILEAMAMGLPVLACGTYAKFVEDGVTGVLQPEFDARLLADAIERMADDRALTRRLGEAGRQRVRTLCDGPARAAELLATWQSVTRTA